MFCRYCGAELTGRFCAACGKPANEPADTASLSSAGRQASAPEPVQQEAFWNPAESMHRVERSAPAVFFAASNATQPGLSSTVPEDREADAAFGGGVSAPAAHEVVGDFNEDADDAAFLFDAAPASAASAPVVMKQDEVKNDPKPKKEKKKEKRVCHEKDLKSARKDKRNKGKKSKESTPAVGEGKKPLRLHSVFPAVLALFFPAAYFFFDIFVVYGDVLTRKTASGLTALQQFINWSTSPAYDANSAVELMSGTFGEAAQTVSPLSLSVLSESTGYLLPLVCTLAAAALSVLAGLLIFCSGARILHCRVFLDLMALAGLAGAAAPLFGETVYLVYLYVQVQSFTAVNRTMAAFGLSVESMLILCICALCLLPAIRRLRSLGDGAAGRNYPVILPCAALGAKFFTAKFLAVLSLVFCFVFPVLFLIGPVYSPELDLAAWNPTGALTKAGEALRTMISGGDAANVWMTVLSLLAETLILLQAPFLAIACLPLLWQFFRVVFTRKHYTPKKDGSQKRRRPAGNVSGDLARGLLLLPFLSFVIFGVLAALLLLFASRLAIHLDFSDPDAALCTVYLVIAYVKSLGGTTCAYALLMLVGAPLWHLVGNFHNAMASHRVPKSSGVLS